LPPGLHQPLLREMLQVADWPDAALLKHIEGFPLAGPLPDTGHYAQALGASAPDAAFLHAELQRALQDAPQELLRLLRSARPDATSAEVLRQTRAEAAAGKFAGPWQVYLDGGQMRSNLPRRSWLPTKRFGRVQNRSHTSYKVRPIDDCTASGLNFSTAARERMTMVGVDTLVALGGLVQRLWPDRGDGDPQFAKGDHAQAYRQWPVQEDHMRLAVSLVYDPAVGPAGGSRPTHTVPCPSAPWPPCGAIRA